MTVTAKKKTGRSNVVRLRGAAAPSRLGFTTEPWLAPSKHISARLDVTFVKPPTEGDRMHLSEHLRDVAEFVRSAAGASLFGAP